MAANRRVWLAAIVSNSRLAGNKWAKLASPLPIAANERVRRAIVMELWRFRAFQFGDDPLRQYLAQLHAPLIEGVNLPDRALREDAVLIERHKLAQRLWREPLGQNRARRAIAFKDTMRHQRVRRPFRLHLLRRLAEGQRLRLREETGHQEVVVRAERIQRLVEADEVGGNQLRSLMDELIERVLAVGARLA